MEPEERPDRDDARKLDGERPGSVSVTESEATTGVSQTNDETPSNIHTMASNGSILRRKLKKKKKPAVIISMEQREEEKGRPGWRLLPDYYSMLLGGVVGLSNVLVFPSYVYAHGGGAFILLYCVMSVCIGIPLFYLEISWGQFCSRGPLQCFNVSPLFKGVGLAIVVNVTIEFLRYTINIVYCSVYISAAFTGLPFKSCNNTWNTRACVQVAPNQCQDFTSYSNGTCYNKDTYKGVWNVTAYELSKNITAVTPSFEYFRYQIQGSYNVTDGTKFEVHVSLALGLLSFWLICFLMLRTGVFSLSKIISLPALFPFFVLIFLFVGVLTTQLHNKTRDSFFKPDWKKLKQPEVYFYAVIQMMFSLGIAWGLLPTLSSYCYFREKVFRPVMLVVFLDWLTSVVSGTVIFTFLGNLDESFKRLRRPGGDLLVFDSFVLSLLEVKQSSLILGAFFFALTLLGMSTEIVVVEVTLTAIMDTWPRCRRHQSKLVAVFCLLTFLVSLPFATKGGYYLGIFLDGYRASYFPFLVTFFNLVVIVVVYGVNRYLRDLEVMLGSPPPKALRYIWTGLIPLIAVIFVWYEVEKFVARANDAQSEDHQKSQRLFGDTVGHIIGWIIFLLPSLCLPFMVVKQIYLRPEQETLMERVKALLAPAPQWGPILDGNREEWNERDSWDESSLTEFTTRSSWSSLSSKWGSVVHPTTETTSTKDDDTIKIRGIIRASGPRPERLSKAKVQLSFKGTLLIPGHHTEESTETASVSMMTVSSGSMDIQPLDDDEGSSSQTGDLVDKDADEMTWLANAATDDEGNSSQGDQSTSLVNANTDERRTNVEEDKVIGPDNIDTDQRRTSSERGNKIGPDYADRKKDKFREKQWQQGSSVLKQTKTKKR